MKIKKPLNKDPSKADTTFDVFLYLSYGFAEIEIIATKQLPFFSNEKLRSAEKRNCM